MNVRTAVKKGYVRVGRGGEVLTAKGKKYYGALAKKRGAG